MQKESPQKVSKLYNVNSCMYVYSLYNKCIIRGEPERAPNTRDTGSGFICIYIHIFVCSWGDYFHEQGVKLQITNVGNGRQARVRTTLKVQSYLQKQAR